MFFYVIKNVWWWFDEVMQEIIIEFNVLILIMWQHSAEVLSEQYLCMSR